MVNIIVIRFLYFLMLICSILIFGCQQISVKESREEPILFSPTKLAKEDPILGPQSQQSLGEQRVLVVAVRFPDVQPRLSLQQIRTSSVEDLDRYVREQSYGLTWMKADFRGWISLPDWISEYRISPVIFELKYQKTRVRKLTEDTMTAIEKDVNFSEYQHMFIIIGAGVRSEKGYGSPCYCANPGLLSAIGRGYHEYALLKSKGGKSFQGGVFVGVQNAHLGMYAHDFFHALGGTHKRWKLVP